MQSLPQESGFGWPHLATAYEDHLDKGLIDTGKSKNPDDITGKAFHINQFPLRDSKDDVKKAGTLSNQRAAAASAWLLGNARTEFRSATMAWTGPLLIAEVSV